MSKLQWALTWARRGFPVFPCVANGKEPLYEATTWYEIATTDEATIRRMWTDPVLGMEKDYNIGVDCTDKIVIDIDVKNGKDGYNQYMQLGGTYETLVVRTPSGGYHCYFEGPDSANAPIGSALDVRSHHGYVLAPGSSINGVPYEIVNDVTPQWIPFNIERLLRAPYERKVHDYASNDSDANIQAGIRFLETAPVAVEGARGDETTFVTAARLVREMALSVPTAFSLMRDHWNDRCIPPWQLDELLQKVENAAQYGTADAGRLDPVKLFAAVPELAPPPGLFEAPTLSFGNALDVAGLSPRPWMLDRMLMLHELTLLLAPGSAGKSSLILALVAHMAMGRDFGPYRCHTRCKSIVYNGEDDKMEQSRRLYAVCDLYGLPYNEVKQNVMLLSAEDVELKLVTAAGRMPVVNETVVREFISLASDPDVGIVAYDPLVDIHDVDEGDSPQMNAVMRVLKRVAREANVASIVAHHTVKAGSSRQEDRVGNMDISRGASGIVYKTRIAFTLLNASQQDAEDFGIQDSERNAWVRLDDAKMQYVLAGGTPTWFHKEGVRIPTGDVVGVLKLTELKPNTNTLRLRLAETLISHLEANNSASMNLTQAIAVVKANEPIYANKTDKDVRQRLEGSFASPVEVRGKTLHVVRPEGSKDVLVTLK